MVLAAVSDEFGLNLCQHAARLHVARTVVRRAERSAWAAYDEHADSMNKPAILYLNRLSDLVFILARHVNREQGDVLWVPGGERG